MEFGSLTVWVVGSIMVGWVVCSSDGLTRVCGRVLGFSFELYSFRAKVILELHMNTYTYITQQVMIVIIFFLKADINNHGSTYILCKHTYITGLQTLKKYYTNVAWSHIAPKILLCMK